MKTALIWIIVLLVLVGGIYWMIGRSTNINIPKTSTQVKDATTTSDYTPSEIATSTATTTPAKTVTVTYTDKGFDPKSVEINVGDTVKFVNNSSRNMWVGSANHPSHTVYDGTNLQAHCKAGATPSFDECKAEAKGASYSFTFTKLGSWGYHNHSRESDFGTVVVK